MKCPIIGQEQVVITFSTLLVGNQPIFKGIIERGSMRCTKAIISICHDQMKAKKQAIQEMFKELTPLISADDLLKRAQAVSDNIDIGRVQKLSKYEFNPSSHFIDNSNWVVNLSNKLLHLRNFFS